MIMLSGCFSKQIFEYQNKLAGIFHIDNIEFDRYNDQIRFSISPIALNNRVDFIDFSKAKLVFFKDEKRQNRTLGSSTSLKLDVERISSTNRFQVNSEKLTNGHYYLHLENFPEQRNGTYKEYTLIKKPIIELKFLNKA
jgi:hypothetical protein